MLTILSLLLLWSPPLVGWGLFLDGNFRKLGIKDSDFPSPGLAGLLGILGVGVTAGALNLLVGLGVWFPVCILSGGWLALAFFRAPLKGKFTFGFALVCALVAVLISISTLFADFVYDAGLYHLPAIRWSLESPLPFGLANLNSYTGYNSIWFLFNSALALPTAEEKGIAIAESLALFFFVLFLLDPLFNYQRTTNRKLAFSLFTLVFFCLSGLEAGAGSNSTDLPLAVYLLGCTLLFVNKEYFLSALFGSFAFAIKLSGGPIALLFIAAAVFFIPRSKKVITSAFSIGILLVCVSRGVFSSGCLLYPEVRSCLSVLPWTVKPALAAERNFDVRNSAGSCLVRPNDQVFDCYLHDLGPALLRQRIVQLLLLSLAIAFIAFWFRRRRPRETDFPLSHSQIAILFHAFGLCFWLLTAPDTRFGVSYFIALSVLPIGTAIRSVRPGRAVVSFSCVLLLALGGLWSKRLLVLSGSVPVKQSWPTVAQVPLLQTKLKTGQTMYQPAEHYSCGFSELPCRVPASYPIEMETKWGRPLFYSPEK